MIVVDASPAVKWFRDEALSEQATQIHEDNVGDIVAPDLLAVEVAAALVRNANEIKAIRFPMTAAMAEFCAMLNNESIRMIRLDPSQLTSAAGLALDLGHSLTDCVYLALAMERSCDLLTCDARFAAKARGVWDRVRVLGE